MKKTSTAKPAEPIKNDKKVKSAKSAKSTKSAKKIKGGADAYPNPIFPGGYFWERNEVNDGTLNKDDKVGIIVVDVVSGFTTPDTLRETDEYKKYVRNMLNKEPESDKKQGYDTFHLAPATYANVQTESTRNKECSEHPGIARCASMIDEIKKLLEVHKNAPVLTFIDSHRAKDVSEPRLKPNTPRSSSFDARDMDSMYDGTTIQKEFAFPPHCVEGSEESLLDYRLYNILEERKKSTPKNVISALKKDCYSGLISGFHPAFESNVNMNSSICKTCRCENLPFKLTGGKRTSKNTGGATMPSYNNAIMNWCAENKITHVIVTGICTDICVMHLVHGLINLINHYKPPKRGGEDSSLNVTGTTFGSERPGTTFKLKRVYVYEPGTASYHLYLAPDFNYKLHDMNEYHVNALNMMKIVGARIINDPNMI